MVRFKEEEILFLFLYNNNNKYHKHSFIVVPKHAPLSFEYARVRPFNFLSSTQIEVSFLSLSHQLFSSFSSSMLSSCVIGPTLSYFFLLLNAYMSFLFISSSIITSQIIIYPAVHFIKYMNEFYLLILI